MTTRLLCVVLFAQILGVLGYDIDYIFESSNSSCETLSIEDFRACGLQLTKSAEMYLDGCSVNLMPNFNNDTVLNSIYGVGQSILTPLFCGTVVEHLYNLTHNISGNGFLTRRTLLQVTEEIPKWHEELNHEINANRRKLATPTNPERLEPDVTSMIFDYDLDHLADTQKTPPTGPQEGSSFFPIDEGMYRALALGVSIPFEVKAGKFSIKKVFDIPGFAALCRGDPTLVGCSFNSKADQLKRKFIAFAAREAAAALEAPVVAGTDGGLGAAITAARVAANFAYSAINTINEVLDMVDNVLSVAKTNVNLDNVKGTIGNTVIISNQVNNLSEVILGVPLQTNTQVALTPLRGYGCNHFDDNLDGVVDECEEDKFPPDIKVSEYSYGSKCFQKEEDAKLFYETNTFVQDDCQPLSRTFKLADGSFTTLTQPAPTFGGFVSSCASSTAVITAADLCGNVATDTIMFNFDDKVPTLTVDMTKINDKCFTDQNVAENVILTSSTTTDDCTAVDLIDLSISSFAKACKDTKATIKAVDLCENVKTVVIPLNFDDEKPLVKIAPLAEKCITSTQELEDALTAASTITDDCTATADLKIFTSVNLQCDESTAVVYATDLCGNVGSDMVKFNFDNKPPTILVSEYSLGSKWITNEEYAQAFFLTNTFTTDDCSSQADTLVTFTDLEKKCAASTALITATDKCGNVGVDTIMFLYDDFRPTVSVEVAKTSLFAAKPKVKQNVVNVGLSVAATDDCTLNPNVTVRVYSDELYDKDVDEWIAKTVQLSRIESSPGVITGWKLLVTDEAFEVCNKGPYYCGGTTHQKGDGRYYTIQVCATDEAGNRACDEATVSVDIKDHKDTAPVNGGKLYLLAEDEISKFRTL